MVVVLVQRALALMLGEAWCRCTPLPGGCCFGDERSRSSRSSRGSRSSRSRRRSSRSCSAGRRRGQEQQTQEQQEQQEQQELQREEAQGSGGGCRPAPVTSPSRGPHPHRCVVTRVGVVYNSRNVHPVSAEGVTHLSGII
jgi:hypothetical protein